jgi:hypothetical protein
LILEVSNNGSHPSLGTRRYKSDSHCQNAILERNVHRRFIGRILNDELTNCFRPIAGKLIVRRYANGSQIEIVPLQHGQVTQTRTLRELADAINEAKKIVDANRKIAN